MTSKFEWVNHLRRWYPKTPRTLVDVKTEPNAWERDFSKHLGTVTHDELCNAISHHASVTCDSAETIPTPMLVVSWVREYRFESRNRKRKDEALSFDAMPVEVQEQCRSVLRKWLDDVEAEERGAKVGEGYEMLRAGEKIRPEYEHWNGSEWVAYGQNAYDEKGQPRIFRAYKVAVARKAKGET